MADKQRREAGLHRGEAPSGVGDEDLPDRHPLDLRLRASRERVRLARSGSDQWPASAGGHRPPSEGESVVRLAARSRVLAPERLAEHIGSLYRAALALCGSREDAEDVVQETYACVLRRPRWLRHGSERAYLMQVLRNVWYDTANSGARRREIPVEPEELDFAADARADPDLLVETHAAYSAIAGLSTPLRETIVAVDILGLSYKEAACVLRTGHGTIMSRLYNARRKAAEAMGGGRR